MSGDPGVIYREARERDTVMSSSLCSGLTEESTWRPVRGKKVTEKYIADHG